MSEHLERGHAAYDSRSWATARDELATARDAGTLEPTDLWKLALCFYLTGEEERFIRTVEDAHHAYMEAGEPTAAVRCAFWLGLHQAERGRTAQASGWFGRARRVLERVDGECAERGYVLLPRGQHLLGAGDHDACVALAEEAEALAQRFGDADLLTLSMHMRGRALLRGSRVDEGLALLDEAMVAVVSDELSPQVTGIVYCGVISACREVWAIRRAKEWTAALTAWCEKQPDMVAYTGECRVYRAEILQWRGAWAEAVEEARLARDRPGAETKTVAASFYQEGEARRLLGELAAAEEAYREASQGGREPQPGLALLRMVQGEPDAAAAATRRALTETTERFRRAALLPAHVEVLLEADEIEEAGRACDELADIASAWGVPVLGTLAAHCRGAVDLASGEAEAALPNLRRAWREWSALDAPYHAARARASVGLACRELGDEDGAALELDAARAELEALGATAAVDRLDTRLGRRRPARDHGLTPREREVLAEVATGRTNRAIADALFISEKTVARHVANIYRKLGLSSRSAATAYAYEHDLVQPPS